MSDSLEFPNSRSALLWGVERHRAGQLEDAAAVYAAVAAVEPDDPHAAYLAAILAVQRQRGDEAVALVGLALEQRPVGPPVRLGLAPVQRKLAPRALAATPQHLQIELTSDCNLRCTYCPVSLPEYQGQQMQPEAISAVLDYVRRSGVRIVNVNGHGETTHIRQWVEIVQQFLATGAELTLVSNFARPLESVEIATLAQFGALRASIDTVDRDTLKDIRRKTDIRTVLTNLLAIKAHALAAGTRPPRFSINCVVSDRVALDLPDLVAHAAALGCADVVLHDVAELSANPDSPRNVGTLTAANLQRARAAIREAQQVGRRHGVEVLLQPSLQDTLDQPPPVEDLPHFKGGAPMKIYVQRTRGGWTRNCVDPWTYLKVDQAGEIMPCCIGAESMGHLRDGPEQVFAGAGFQRRRQQLLDGDLPHECAVCPAREQVPLAALRRRLQEMGYL